MDASELVNRPTDVTRSTVQKAVVVIADSPQFFGQLREKLSMVTGAWFAQKYEQRVQTGWEVSDFWVLGILRMSTY